MDRDLIHRAVNELLDAIERREPAAPPAHELVRATDLPFDVAARRALVRSGQLKVVRIGRELFTSRSAVAALYETLPPATLPGPKPAASEVDDLADAARKRAARRAA